MTLKIWLMRTVRSAAVLLPLTAGMPAMSGCGTDLDDFDDALDQLFEDLEDADDLEEFGEAWDDFFEDLDD